MAYNFIGESPDPLPLPPGLVIDPKRFIGTNGPMPSKGPPLESRNESPKQLKVRYMKTKPDGRLKAETLLIDDLPEFVTVRYMILQIREMLRISPRHPVELRYWGEPLELTGTGADGEEQIERTLAYYSIKEHSELNVVIKPLLPLAQARQHRQCEPNVNRLRVVSHKLASPIPIEGIVPELRIRDLKAAIVEWLKKNPIYLVRGPPRPGIMCATAIDLMKVGDQYFERKNLKPADLVNAVEVPAATNVEVKAGDHFIKDSAGGAAKGKGPAGMRRVSDGLVGTLQEPDFWEMKLDEETMPMIQFDGFNLPDDSLVSSHGFVNHELVFLHFRLPWEPDDPKPVAKEGGGKGKKKK